MALENDVQLNVKVRKSTERISENIHIVANEPSLAFYRLQEHVRKALPPMVEKRIEVMKLNHELTGRCYDVEYALSAIKSSLDAENSFKNTEELLKNSLFYRQQIKYMESKRNSKESKDSVYKRLSAHITLDLPDLPELSDALRETASKVESIMTQNRSSTNSHP